MFESFAEVPAYPLVFPVFYGALAIFALVMARHLRVLAAAQPVRPFADVRLRVGGLLVYVLGQWRLFRDRAAGPMHAGIFWGFVLLTIGTVDIVTGGLVRFVLSAPLGGAIWAAVVALQNVIAVVVLAAIAVAFYRRLVLRPRRLSLSNDALVILSLIAGVVASELLAQTFEAARSGTPAGAIVAGAMAGPLRGVPDTTLGAWFATAWWLHIVLVAAFLCYLPWSKHLHIVTSFFNVYFRKLEPRGQLPAMDLEREDVTYGLRTLADLGWKDLLDGFTCTECGRCQAACPANRTGKPLDPKALVMGIRHMSVAAERGVDFIPNSPIVRETYGLDDRLGRDRLSAPIVGDAISEDAVWDCVTCGACVEACPVLIEHVDKIVGLRRNLVLEDARFPTELGGAFRSMEGAGNPWGLPRTARLDWANALPFDVPTVAEVAAAGGLARLDVLYWVGCAAAFDERNRRVARAFVSCLHAAGVRFAVLGQEETCTGDPARRMGNEYVFQMLAGENIETFRRYALGELTVVTACPHCFNTLGNEYGQLGAKLTVVPHAAYLRELLAQGRLRISDGPVDGAAADGARGAKPAPRTAVTLHDACYLSRYNGIVGQPRDILAALPDLEVREMAEHGRTTFCCGAGGGRMFMEETRGTRINEERGRQALATGAGAVVTECPFCMTMLSDGLTEVQAAAPAAGAGGAAATVRAVDIAELLAERCEPGPAALAAGTRGRELPVLP